MFYYTLIVAAYNILYYNITANTNYVFLAVY